MNHTPETIRGVSDHIINDAFVKTAPRTDDRVLVVQANLEDNSDIFNDATVTLFETLETVSKDAQSQVGSVDYIDVRIN